MTTRMLIDARHQEETRVAVLQGNRIEEFDFESAEHKQIKGNIYLAKVTRVEPSLQAAFVDFGGNRHGFLAFSEIHPDYYQIPREDREALLAEEAAHAEEEEALRAAESEDDGEVGENAVGDDFAGDDLDDAGGVTEIDTSEKDQVATIEAGHVENGFAGSDDDDDDDDGEGDGEADDEDGAAAAGGEGRNRSRRGGSQQSRGRSKEAEDLRNRRMALRRRYKIQDVIHRRQVLLVQVVKEERGNKGAALTSYLSLAGRYCVLMPNSSHGGGISRKISSAADRKRLKSIVSEMSLPKSMGCIVRTAGLSRTKTEIKRDFDYLARLWDEIRENTLKSSAPAGIHSDSDLIKRAIRDIYNRDIEEVVVEGEDGYRAARDFMKLLMPSHARRVKPYSDPVPLFQRYGAEDQLTAMYDPVVQLRSGGYIVINPTEALVSIDINSGRSTKEYGIEATALNTNLEAAREIARQLRLRDMAGLVVIDFIDMEHGSSVRKVEKAMKDALRDDRARIQVGRISSFGLMEMSRQRLRTGVLEATTRMCPHCDGSGLVRTASSAGLSALRLIEEEAAKGRGNVISLFASTEASIYLLNAKRADLGEIEERYGVRVEVLPEGENEGAKMRVGSSGPRPEFVPRFAPIPEIEDEVEEDDTDYGDDEDVEVGEAAEETREDEGAGRSSRRKRGKRRQGGRGQDRREAPASGEIAELEGEGDAPADASPSGADETAGEEGEAPRKRRRRGRRRRGRGAGEDASELAGEESGEGVDSNEPQAVAGVDGAAATDPHDTPREVESPLEAAADAKDGIAQPEVEPAAPQPVKRGRRKAAPVESDAPAEAAEVSEAPAKRTRRKKVADVDAAEPAEPAAPKPRAPRRKANAATEAMPSLDLDSTASSAPESETTAVGDEVSIDAPAIEPIQPERLVEAPVGVADEQSPPSGDPDQEDGDEPRRGGWWQRTFGP
ncbi:MAG: ribonuclease E/G [Novosphingobium sp.]